MKLSALIEILTVCQAVAKDQDPEVLTSFEDLGPERAEFSFEETEEVSDIRLVDDWPLPGQSMLYPEKEKPAKVVIFYRNYED